MTTTKEGILECSHDGILVQRVPSSLLDGSENNDFDWCNTCHHITPFKLSFFEDTPREDDNSFTTIQKIQAWETAAARWQAWYSARLSQTKMDQWFPVLGKDLCGDRGRNAVVLEITAEPQQKYFQPASQLAQNCAKTFFEEEANELATLLLEKYSAAAAPPCQGWFVRTSACSPKDAFQDGGSGPHHSLGEALLALMASERVHRTLRKQNYANNAMTVYLMPFDPEVNVDRELRVFVHENTVRAISQYNVYSSSDIFAPMTVSDLARVARKVDVFHCNEVKPRWTTRSSSYTMDLEYIGENGEEKIRLVELNSFGSEMAAASALFHWERDRGLLYGRTKDEEEEHSICIRVRD